MRRVIGRNLSQGTSGFSSQLFTKGHAKYLATTGMRTEVGHLIRARRIGNNARPRKGLKVEALLQARKLQQMHLPRSVNVEGCQAFRSPPPCF